MASLADIALWSSIAPILVGTIFMVTAPKQVAEGFYNLEVRARLLPRFFSQTATIPLIDD
jgi:hypothetical protein